jgi:hypothetical protein
MAKQFDSFGVADMAAQAIRSGTSAEDFAKQIMDHVAKRGTAWTPEIGMSSTEARRFSIVRAVSAMLSNDWSKAGLEREASNAFAEKAKAAGIQRQAENSLFLPMEVQKRDMTVGTTTAGGHMVATTLRPQDFIELLRNATLLKSWAPARWAAWSATPTSPSRPAPRPATGFRPKRRASPRASRPSACCNCGRKCWAPTPRFPACCCSKARRMPICS